MTRVIHNFVWGNMDWESTIDLLSRVSKSNQWIDYLIMEMELYEYFVNRENYDSPISELEVENCDSQ